MLFAGFAVRAPGWGNGGNACGGCCAWAAAIARSSAITFIINNYTMRSAAAIATALKPLSSVPRLKQQGRRADRMTYRLD